MTVSKIVVLVALLALLVKSKRKIPEPHSETHYYPVRFGISVSDEFYYMGNENYTSDALGYTAIENQFSLHNYDKRLTKVTTDDLKRLSKPYFDSVTDLGSRIGKYYYYRRTGKFNTWIRDEPSTSNTGTIILDEEAIHRSLGKPNYFRIGRVIPSPSGRYVAYTVDVVGFERYSVYFRDTKEGKDLENVIHNTNDGYAWSSDDKYFMYEANGELLSRQTLAIKSHTIADKTTTPVMSTDSEWEFSLSLTSDTKFIVVTKKNYRDGCVVYYLDLTKYTADPTFIELKINQRKPGTEYFVDHRENYGWFSMMQDSGRYGNFALVKLKGTAPEGSFDVDVYLIEENVQRVMMNLQCSTNYAYVMYYDTRFYVPLVLRVPLNATNDKTNFAFNCGEFLGNNRACDPFLGPDYPILGTDKGKWMRDGQETDNYQMVTSNFIFAPSIVMHEPNSGEDTRIVTPSKKIDGFKTEYYTQANMETTIIHQNISGKIYNITVPVRLFGKNKQDKGKKKGIRYRIMGHRPVWITIHSQYGEIAQPRFNPFMVPLLERGFIYGMILARGSRNKGVYWHRIAQENRKYQDEDIMNGVQHLIDTDWIKKGNQVILHGKGASTIPIVGAMTRNRDLYNLTLLENPFISLFDKLLGSKGGLDRTEYGDIRTTKKLYSEMIKYDPYLRFSGLKANYPNIYMIGGWKDGRTYFGDGCKFFAKLRQWALQNDDTYIMKIKPYSGYLGTSNYELEEDLEGYLTDLHSFIVKTMQGYVWHDPLEWLWILLCILVLACWMICFMMLFICCELRTKRREKRKEKKKKAEEEKKKALGLDQQDQHQDQQDGKQIDEDDTFGTFASIDNTHQIDNDNNNDDVDGYGTHHQDQYEDQKPSVYVDRISDVDDLNQQDNSGLIGSQEGDGLPDPIPFDQNLNDDDDHQKPALYHEVDDDDM